MDFKKFMEQVRAALGLAPDATLEETVTGVASLNKRVKELEEGRQTLKTELDDFATELRKRVALGEATKQPEGDFRIMRNGFVRPNVSRECAKHIVDLVRHNRAHSAGVDAEGGYLVAPEFATEIIRLIPTVGVYRRIARTLPMKSDELNFGTLLSGLSIYWPGENNKITRSYAGLGQLKLNAKIMAGLTEAPESLLDDATPDMGDLLIDLFIEGIGGEEDRVGLVASVAGGDPFDGILSKAGTVPVVFAAGGVGFATIGTTAGVDKLRDMQTAIPDGARANAIYIMSPTVFNEVCKAKDGENRYIFQPATASHPDLIHGRPFELSEHMPAMADSAADTPFVAYGDPKRLFLGDRKQLAVARSTVAGEAFERIQEMIRVHERIAINSHAAGFAVLKTAAA